MDVIPTPVLADCQEAMPARHALLVADALPGILTRFSIPSRLLGLQADQRHQLAVRAGGWRVSAGRGGTAELWRRGRRPNW